VATVLIKKYGNRRLYDTGDSRYITLDELATKIRSGIDVRVVDAQTGEDLTQASLVQLVLEAGSAAKFLPVQLLTQMIRLSDDSLAEFFSRYVTNALDIYLQAKRFNPLTRIPMAAGDALARMWMGSPFGGYQPQYGGGYAAPPPAMAYPPNGQGGAEPPPFDLEPPAHHAQSTAHSEQTAAKHNGNNDDVATMRRELEELKQAVRDSMMNMAKPARKKKKPL
jgi:polyhydroxyalkanoate synthesis repressor PhaR